MNIIYYDFVWKNQQFSILRFFSKPKEMGSAYETLQKVYAILQDRSFQERVQENEIEEIQTACSALYQRFDHKVQNQSQTAMGLFAPKIFGFGNMQKTWGETQSLYNEICTQLFKLRIGKHFVWQLERARNNQEQKLFQQWKPDDHREHDQKTEKTLLHEAAAHGCHAIASTLIGRGADLNAQDCEGNTPLHEAVGSQHESVAELLLDKGANVKLENRGHLTPLRSPPVRGIYFW